MNMSRHYRVSGSLTIGMMRTGCSSPILSRRVRGTENIPNDGFGRELRKPFGYVIVINTTSYSGTTGWLGSRVRLQKWLEHSKFSN